MAAPSVRIRLATVATALLAGSCVQRIEPEPLPDFAILVDSVFRAYDRCGLVEGATPFLAEAEPLYVAALARDMHRSREARIARYEREHRSDLHVFDPSAFRACLRALEDDETCGALASGAGLPLDCEHVLKGTQTSGQDCAQNLDCEADLFCTVSVLSPCGTCRERAALGQSCVLALCQDGLVCGEDERCIRPEDAPRPPAEGDPCVLLQDDCGDVYRTGLYCDTRPGEGAGFCRPTLVVEYGEVCDQRRRLCRDSFMASFCDFDETQTLGVCRSRPRVGEPCDPDPGCDRAEAVCLDGTCRPLLEEGEPCDPAGADLRLCGALLTCPLESAAPVCTSALAVDYAMELPDCSDGTPDR